MRNIPEFNFPAFHAAAAYLRSRGYDVFNPAERDIERHGGVDISKGNATGSEEQSAKEHGFNLREALGDDLAWICAKADAVCLLPGWENSKGAVAERATAIALGLEVFEYEIMRWDERKRALAQAVELASKHIMTAEEIAEQRASWARQDMD